MLLLLPAGMVETPASSNFVDLRRRISMASKSSTDQSRRRRIFFRAAAVAFNVQFFDAITEFFIVHSQVHFARSRLEMRDWSLQLLVEEEDGEDRSYRSTG